MTEHGANMNLQVNVRSIQTVGLGDKEVVEVSPFHDCHGADVDSAFGKRTGAVSQLGVMHCGYKSGSATMPKRQSHRPEYFDVAGLPIVCGRWCSS